MKIKSPIKSLQLHFKRPTAIILMLLMSAGFIEGKSKKPTCYEYIENFRDGLALVSRNGKYGFINENGKEVIKCKFKVLESFSPITHLAYCKNNSEKIGYINKKGKFVIPPIYDEVHGWDYENKMMYVKRKGKYGFINFEGKEIIPCIYQQTNATPEKFFNGIVRMKKNGKYGILNLKGQVVVNFEFDYFIGHDWLEGFAKDFISAQKGEDYFVINMRTFEIKKTEYNYIGEFKEGLAIVKKNDNYGFIDTALNLIIDCKFRDAGPFSNGYAEVSDETMKWGYIDKKGNPITSIIYDRVREFNNNRALTIKDSQAAFIDTKGKLINNDKYDFKTYSLYYYKHHHGFENNWAVVVKNDKYGTIDTNGNQLIPCQYDYINFAADYRLNFGEYHPLKDNYALAFLNNRKYYIDSIGRIDTNHSSSKLIYFVESIACICDSNKQCVFIDTKGDTIIKEKYDYWEYSTFKNGLAIVKKNNKFGVINSHGETILNTEYDRVSYGLNYILVLKDGTYYFMDKNKKLKFTICKSN